MYAPRSENVTHQHNMCTHMPVALSVTTHSVYHMCRNNVMGMTYVLGRHRRTDCCPVLSVGAHGALL